MISRSKGSKSPIVVPENVNQDQILRTSKAVRRSKSEEAKSEGKTLSLNSKSSKRGRVYLPEVWT